MTDLLFFLVSGVCVGAIYALIAVGYTLVYGIIKLINFAHGEFYMAGAYAGFGLYVLLSDGLPPAILIPVMVLGAGCAGAAIAAAAEWIAYRPIRKSGRMAALLTAIGVSILLQNLFAFIHSAQPLQYPSTVPGTVGAICQGTFKIGGDGIKVIHLVYIAVAAVSCLGLWRIVMATNFGKAMRAVSQDAEAAALMGIDIDSVIRRTFILGGFMAGMAGTLVALASVTEPLMGFLPGLKAFIAAVLGGIGSIPGAVLGGFLLGVIESIVVWIGVSSGWKDIAAFALLILVLVMRPQGILGRLQREKV